MLCGFARAMMVTLATPKAPERLTLMAFEPLN
jgi:hypothetical protein